MSASIFFLFQNYLLNIYHVPGTGLGFGDEKLNVMKNCTITSPWSSSDFSCMCVGQSLTSLGLPQTASLSNGSNPGVFCFAFSPMLWELLCPHEQKQPEVLTPPPTSGAALNSEVGAGG